MQRYLILFIAIAIVLVSSFLYDFYKIDDVDSPVAMLSVSSDGKYVISSHYGELLILWDIQKKTKKVLNKKTNIFSPFFIPNTHDFLWQDATTNVVHLESIKGEMRRSFNPGFSVFGHVSNKNLEHYIASDKDWSLFFYKNGIIRRFKQGLEDGMGRYKLFHLSLRKNYLLSVGDSSFENEKCPFIMGSTSKDIYPNLANSLNDSLLRGLVLWNTRSNKPLKKFIGLSGKSVADLSLDTKYVVGADEQSILYVWETKTGKKLFHSNNPVETDFNCCGQKKCLDNLDELIQTKMVIPADFYSHPDSNGAVNVAVKFIDEEGDFIRFIEAVNYGTLYNVHSPKIRAYMPLGTYPKPNIYDLFSNANIIDTAPKANILVMGQQPEDDPRSKGGTGIIVYHFDKKTNQLERIWAPEGPPPHRPIRNNDNHWER